jgi:hypothetical protein
MALMGGLVDGETVVAAVVDVTIETNDVVVDTDVVEVLDSVVWADVADEKDVFFLALSDYDNRLSALALGGTRPMQIVTHVKLPIRFYFRIRNHIGSLLEGRVVTITRSTVTGSRFRCLQPPRGGLFHPSSREEKWIRCQRATPSPGTGLLLFRSGSI